MEQTTKQTSIIFSERFITKHFQFPKVWKLRKIRQTENALQVSRRSKGRRRRRKNQRLFHLIKMQISPSIFSFISPQNRHVVCEEFTYELADTQFA